MNFWPERNSLIISDCPSRKRSWIRSRINSRINNSAKNPRLVLFAANPLFLSLIIIFSVLSSCSGLEKFEKRELVIEGRGGKVIVIAEIARTDAQRQQGLMYRKEIKDGLGMLFVYERDQVMSFWMKNTLVPLSIAYIAQDGRILEIFNMEPGDLNPVQSSRSVRYALEVPQGWFDRAGIGPGDIIDVKSF